jgi:hypothetical protein
MADNRELVEIKITVGGLDETETVETALHSLKVGGSRAGRQIYFLEDTSPRIGERPRLLEAGIVLRLRGSNDGKSDSTVKLRPCWRSQLAKGWTRPSQLEHSEFRIEQDWAGERHALAASCVAKLGLGRLRRVFAGDADIIDAFQGPQLEFLAKCADLRVNLAGLGILGPIVASRWERTAITGAVAERWTVGTLDFLEVSIRARSVRDAVKDQAAFQKAVTDLGIQLAGDQETKTRRVLTYLIAESERQLGKPMWKGAS